MEAAFLDWEGASPDWEGESEVQVRPTEALLETFRVNPEAWGASGIWAEMASAESVALVLALDQIVLRESGELEGESELVHPAEKQDNQGNQVSQVSQVGSCQENPVNQDNPAFLRLFQKEM